MAKAFFWKTEDVETLSASITCVADRVKALRPTVEALSASCYAKLNEISSSDTATIQKDTVLSGLKELSDGLAGVVDRLDVMRTDAKSASTSTKTILAGIKVLSTNIDSIYKDIEATSAYLEAEIKDLLDLSAGVEAISPSMIARIIGRESMSTTKLDRFVGKRRVFFDSEDELPVELISNLLNISSILKYMGIGYDVIQGGIELTSKGSEKLFEIIDFAYERVKSFLKSIEVLTVTVEATSRTEKVFDFRKTVHVMFYIFSSVINVAKVLDLINTRIHLVHSGFDVIHEGILLVNDCMQEALKDIKAAFGTLEYFLSQPAGTIIKLNS